MDARPTTIRIPDDLADRLRVVVEAGLLPHELGIRGPRARVSLTRIVEQMLRASLPSLERKVSKLQAQKEADKNQFRLTLRRGRLILAPPENQQA